jgi:hypothetical protein
VSVCFMPRNPCNRRSSKRRRTDRIPRTRSCTGVRVTPVALVAAEDPKVAAEAMAPGSLHSRKNSNRRRTGPTRRRHSCTAALGMQAVEEATVGLAVLMVAAEEAKALHNPGMCRSCNRHRTDRIPRTRSCTSESATQVEEQGALGAEVTGTRRVS